MTLLHEQARAKLNLTLRICGRTPDGFHEVESVTVFPALSDALAMELGAPLGCDVEGRFATAIDGGNLVLRAAAAARELVPDLVLGRFTLTKSIPVAAGLGGGSADAAAALRLLARANPGRLAETDLRRLAASLGSDVAACLESRPVVMRGRGDRLTPIAGLPGFGVLLGNPLLPLGAGEVYRECGAAPLPSDFQRSGEAIDFKASFAALCAYLESRGNDLQAPASRLAPILPSMLESLKRLPGAVAARLSGSGPTCFALFKTRAEAEAASDRMQTAHPQWWVAASAVDADG